MAQSTAKTYVRISRAEYDKLKVLQKRFEQFLRYFEHIHDIKEARRDVKAKKTISQEKLFNKLGL